MEQNVIVGGKMLSIPVYRDALHTKPAKYPVDGEDGHVVIGHKDFICTYKGKRGIWEVNSRIADHREREPTYKTALR